LNRNNFRFPSAPPRALMMPMRRIATIIALASPCLAAAPVPAQYGWERDAMYAYRVKIQTTESGTKARYISSITGHVVYHCRAANPHGFTLRAYNETALARHTTAGKRFPPFGVFRLGWKLFDGRQLVKAHHEPADVIFRSNGQVISRNSANLREFDFADLTRLVLVELAPANQVNWAVTEPVVIHHQARTTAPGRVGLVKVDTAPLPGKLTIEFARENNSLASKLLAEVESKLGKPRIRIEGTGETTFDKTGIPARHSWDGKIFITEKNIERTVPIQIEWNRLAGAAAVQVLRPPAPAPRLDRRIIPADELKTTLARLRQPFTQHRLQLLAKVVLGDPKTATTKLREETAAMLVELLRHDDPFVRRDAARALANWGSPKSLPAIIAALDDAQMTVRWAAVDALGSLRDPRGMGAVAKHLGSGREIPACTNALGFFGRAIPGIEPHLTPLLKNKNVTVRTETCRLLAAFGTRQSQTALKIATLDSIPEVAKAAAAALKTISQRP